MLFFSVRQQGWLLDPLCCHCKRSVATCLVGRAYLCGHPDQEYSCAHYIATDESRLPGNIGKKKRPRENKSRHKRGRASGRAVRRRYR